MLTAALQARRIGCGARVIYRRDSCKVQKEVIARGRIIFFIFCAVRAFKVLLQCLMRPNLHSLFNLQNDIVNACAVCRTFSFCEDLWKGRRHSPPLIHIPFILPDNPHQPSSPEVSERRIHFTPDTVYLTPSP
jgi:hypothetical protein